jgi:hypothetical protein
VIVWVLAAHLRPTAWDSSLHTAGLDHRTAGLTAVAVAVSASSEYLAYVVAAVGTAWRCARGRGGSAWWPVFSCSLPGRGYAWPWPP